MDDWGPATDMTDRTALRVPAMAAAVTSRIRDELDEYSLVPIDEHRRDVRSLLERLLEAVAQRRLLQERDLTEIVHLARRRARQGVSVGAVVSGFHIGNRALWLELSTGHDERGSVLVEMATLLLGSMQAISTTLASTHQREIREQDRWRLTLSQRLVELLVAGDRGQEATRLATQLGVDERRPLVAIALEEEDAGPGAQEQALPDLRRDDVRARIGRTRLFLLGEERAAGPHGGSWVPPAAAGRPTTSRRVGVGTPGLGLRGWETSLGQAKAALAIATARSPVRVFADVWPWCGIAPLSPLMPTEVVRAVAVARDNPALCETVRAFAQADLSKLRCATAGHVHPNTVAYRLSRWKELVGLDARTFDGLTRSLLICHLADSTEAGEVAASGPQALSS